MRSEGLCGAAEKGNLPPLHPLVDLCNAVSVAYAIPIAVFDLAHVAGNLQVRHATGDEDYLAFSGEHQRPDAGEVIFADEQRHVHARRWCKRQSACQPSAERRQVLIVAEAHAGHGGARWRGWIGALERELAAL